MCLGLRVMLVLWSYTFFAIFCRVAEWIDPNVSYQFINLNIFCWIIWFRVIRWPYFIRQVFWWKFNPFWVLLFEIDSTKWIELLYCQTWCLKQIELQSLQTWCPKSVINDCYISILVSGLSDGKCHHNWLVLWLSVLGLCSLMCINFLLHHLKIQNLMCLI